MVEVACAVIRRDGLYLVCQRSPRHAQPGKWEFPGGKIEPGESPEQALVREIDEELGVTLMIWQALPIVDWPPPATSGKPAALRLHPFLCRLELDQQIKLREHSDSRWLTHEQLGRLDLSPADVPILAFLRP